MLREARFFKKSVFADSTKSTYKSQVRAYLRYCLYFGRTPVPADQTTLIGYIAFLARSISPRSIQCYLNVIRIMHLCVGLPNPLLNNWEVQMLKRGIKRVLAVAPVQKLPITVPMLLSMYSQLSHSPKDLCFWAACLIAFYGFLRKSSLLQKSENCDPRKGIMRGDLCKVSTESMSIIFRNSKTIQFGQRVHVLPFAACTAHALCPIRALLTHLTVSKLGSNYPLFAYKEGGVVRMITHYTFTNRLKSLLANAGFNPKLISAHSFRRGGTSFAIGAGMNSLIVKARGDWASNAFERYVHLTDQSTLQAACLLSQAVARAQLASS